MEELKERLKLLLKPSEWDFYRNFVKGKFREL